ncbi:hypothetical protein [Bacillus pumilus]|uniref:hypothetical protein n=1 Tax=Bacillus pumilus TaxID=1408 RepID=UPI0011E980CA|nr:hypothetical protein [Bacillus pumilus]TYS40463.1 hypothetical protein FZC68_16780 [Bacillus pumilus]
MPYIDSTPREYPSKFEEDNLQDMFAELLTNNGWVVERTFYKAAYDTRAHYKTRSRVNYAAAKHTIFRNSDGILFGLATVGYFDLKFRQEEEIPIRTPGDGLTPSWNEWIRTQYENTVTRSSLYFYMLEKMPNEELIPDNGLATIVTMPGMGNSEYQTKRDMDSDVVKTFYNPDLSDDYDEESRDLNFDGKLLNASKYHVIRSALDIEVWETKWVEKFLEVVIVKTDPRVMQSPINKANLRAEHLDVVENPIWHTNWWTDSEVTVQGHVDSKGIFLVLQADTAPAWEHNLVPTVPLYFGPLKSMIEGEEDEGYALFSGAVPPVTTNKDEDNRSVLVVRETVSSQALRIPVSGLFNLGELPAYLEVAGSDEIVKIVDKEIIDDSEFRDGIGYVTVERGQLGTTKKLIPMSTNLNALSEKSYSTIDFDHLISLFDFDDPEAQGGTLIQPLLKLYPNHPSNGIDSVIVSRSRFGARYQAHYLSWGATTNEMPPLRRGADKIKKYPRSYEPMEETQNYKYQHNPSRYSEKTPSTRIYVSHPEEGNRGYLDKAIAFNPQGLRASKLKVMKEGCPDQVYGMYKPMKLGAVSPLTKVPATPFRPAGLGIYIEDHSPTKEPPLIDGDTTPPSDVVIVEASSPKSQTLDLKFTLPTEADFSHLNIYVNGKVHAKGVTGTDFYRIAGIRTGTTPEVKVTSVDLAGNESAGAQAPAIKVI